MAKLLENGNEFSRQSNLPYFHIFQNITKIYKLFLISQTLINIKISNP